MDVVIMSWNQEPLACDSAAVTADETQTFKKLP